MTLAEETRAAVRDRPFLLEGLRAGVVNYAGAARSLGIGDDHDAVAAALRRFADRLPPRAVTGRRASVTMEAGLTPMDPPAEGLIRVGDTGFSAGDGRYTGLLASGDVDADALTHALGVIRAHGIPVTAAGFAGDALVVVVARSDGPDALRRLESALAAVPNPTG